MLTVLLAVMALLWGLGASYLIAMHPDDDGEWVVSDLSRLDDLAREHGVADLDDDDEWRGGGS